jgi:gliding motility-associated protein GldL|tara:strand:+ start:58 stop:717 length:660 start_codon:yes stop_codon:yes gene_type:complete
MDDKALNKRLRSKVAMHMLFGLGGAVVIIGALFKILHLEIGPITGGLVLGIGLGTEALIFTVSALNTGEIKEEHDDFVKKAKGGGSAKPSGASDNEGLSSKIDNLMKEAKLDVSLMNNLTSSIKNLESSAKALEPASTAISSSSQYSEQLDKAASQLDELNKLYSAQVKSTEARAGKDTVIRDQMEADVAQLKKQMESLSANLASLNDVYGGMLSVMKK